VIKPSPLWKKYDPVLYLILALLFAASCVNAFHVRRGNSDLSVVVTRDGNVIMSEPLYKITDTEMTFGEPGNFNEIAFGDGVRMTSSDCPGGDCIRTGVIKSAGEVIACLPHKFAIRLVSRQKPRVDAVSH